MEDRQQIFDQYTGPKNKVSRPFLLYTRYFEANLLVQELEKRGIDLTDLKVMDYGCGVGDYGITFARKKSPVWFYDISTEYMDFVRYRMSLEKLPWHEELQPNFVIFGEVLEHLEDKALEVMQERHDKGATYIFTSSYPYRSDDPTDRYWSRGGHSEAARLIQPACRSFLETNYDYVKFEGQLRLWTRK